LCSLLHADRCVDREFGHQVRLRIAGLALNLLFSIIIRLSCGESRAGDSVAVTERRMLYLGGIKPLHPTPGFPSAGTPSFSSPVLHLQARCLLTTSNLRYLHETQSFRHVCKICHLPYCPRCLCQCCPSGVQRPTYECTLTRFRSFLLTSITDHSSRDLEVRHDGHNSRGLGEGTTISHPLSMISPAHVSYSCRPRGPPHQCRYSFKGKQALQARLRVL